MNLALWSGGDQPLAFATTSLSSRIFKPPEPTTPLSNTTQKVVTDIAGQLGRFLGKRGDVEVHSGGTLPKSVWGK